jgi:hypothetical protein
MKTFLILLLLGGALNTVAQIEWSKASHWKIYKIPESIIFKVRLDSLSQLNSRPLFQDSVVSYMGTSRLLPDSINPVWMGGWVATYEYSGQVHKIQISAYGGFFYDQSSGRYYEIPIGLRDEWMTYVNQLLSSM